MDAPPVRYAKTADGFGLAYIVRGQGIPFVFLPLAVNHVRLSWEISSAGSWLTAASERFHLVHFDNRGQGLSTRGLCKDFRLATTSVTLRLS